MSLPSKKINKIQLDKNNSESVYEIIPGSLQSNGYQLSPPTLTGDATIATTADISALSDNNFYHTPDFSTGIKIGTGVGLDNLYVPVGTTSSTVASGSHNHTGTYQPLDADLTAISSLNGNSGLLKKTAADTWSLDTTAYTPKVSSTTDNAIARYDGTTGSLQNSSVTLDDNGVIKTTGSIVLSTVNGSINDASSSRLYFGSSTSSYYSFLGSNTSGAFSLASQNGNFTFYANTGTYNTLMNSCGADLGRNDTDGSKSWNDIFTKGSIKKYNGSNGWYTLSYPAKSGTFALTSDIPSPTVDTNQKITVKQSGSNVNFGNDATVEIKAGTNVTITPDTSSNTITIDSSYTNTTYTISASSTNGNITVTPSSGAAYDVSIPGLGDNAYTSTVIPTVSTTGVTAGGVTYNASNKLDKKPDSTNDLISNNKISTTYLPDFVLGQLIYGGTVTGAGVATLSTNAKTKLGTTSNTITLTNNNTTQTGYKDNEGIFYVVSSDGSFASLGLKTGDWLISVGNAWKKIDNTDEVTSVNGQTGNVTIDIPDIDITTTSVTDGTTTFSFEVLDIGSNTSGTLSAANLAKLVANPHLVQLKHGNYYYYPENVTSSTTWYYSCPVYYNSNSIVKRVITITTATGAWTKSEYTYTPTHQSIKSLDTTATTAQNTNASEAVAGSGTVTLHKISKTGTYGDLLGTPITVQDLKAQGFTPTEGAYYKHTGQTIQGAESPLEEDATPGTIYFDTTKSVEETLLILENMIEDEDVVGRVSDGISLYTFVSATAEPVQGDPDAGDIMLYYIWYPATAASVRTDGLNDPIFYLIAVTSSGMVPIFSNAPLISELLSPTEGWNTSSISYTDEIKFIQEQTYLNKLMGSTNSFANIQTSAIYHYTDSSYVGIDNENLSAVALTGKYKDLLEKPDPSSVTDAYLANESFTPTDGSYYRAILNDNSEDVYLPLAPGVEYVPGNKIHVDTSREQELLGFLVNLFGTTPTSGDYAILAGTSLGVSSNSKYAMVASGIVENGVTYYLINVGNNSNKYIYIYSSDGTIPAEWESQGYSYGFQNLDSNDDFTLPGSETFTVSRVKSGNWSSIFKWTTQTVEKNKIYQYTEGRYKEIGSGTVTITTTSGSESISDGTNTLNFGSNAFTSTTIPTTYVRTIDGNSGDLYGIATTSDLNDYLKLDGTSTMTGVLNLKATGNNDTNIGDNGIRWGTTSLPEQTSPQYFCVIDGFAQGGRQKWSSLTNVKSAIGSIKNPNKLNLKVNNESSNFVEYDGSAAKTITIKPSSTSGAFVINDGTTDKTIQLAGTFTDTDTKVTAVGNHYTPSGGSAITVSSSGTATRGSTVVLTGITKDAAGHITGVTAATLPASDNTNTTYTFAEGSTNGAFSVTPSGGSAQSVAIHGLGSNAYTSTSYIPTSGSTAITGQLTLSTAASQNLGSAAKPWGSLHTIYTRFDSNGGSGSSYSNKANIHYDDATESLVFEFV